MGTTWLVSAAALEMWSVLHIDANGIAGTTCGVAGFAAFVLHGIVEGTELTLPPLSAIPLKEEGLQLPKDRQDTVCRAPTHIWPAFLFI